MSMTTVDVRTTHIELAELLSLAKEGNEVILTEGNTPIARLVPVLADKPLRIADLHRGAIVTSDDFDEPLPEEFWTGTAL